MKDHWYYAKADTKHGPYSADEIRRLAESGDLDPADLVWKTGMDDWQPAESIPGLFAKSSPPPLPKSGVDASAEQPPIEQNTVSGSLIGNVQRAAKSVADRQSFANKLDNLAVWARERWDWFASRMESASDASGQTVDSVATQAPTSRRTIGMLGGCGCLVVAICLCCGLFGAFLDLFGSSGQLSDEGFTSAEGETGYTLSALTLPPPVQQASESGDEVWELSGYKEADDDQRVFIVLDDGTLKYLIPVTKQSKSVANVYYGKDNAPDRDVYGWMKQEPRFESDNEKINWQWNFEKSESAWTLVQKKRVEVKPHITTTETVIKITIDEEVGEGFWRMTRTKHTEYRGSLSRFPDKTETEHDEGAFWPVPRN